MNSNYLICRNEVYIEDIWVGQFESFVLTGNDKQLGDSAVLTLPLYAIGIEQQGEARSRMREVFKPNVIKPFAHVEVYMWYEGYKKMRVFNGLIEQVVEGFPTTLYLRDFTLILKFGRVQKVWGDVKMTQIMQDILPIANEAFAKERENMGFDINPSIPELTYTTDGPFVQATTSTFPFNNPVDFSPYDTVQRLMQLMVLYGGVTDDGKVYIGGLTKNSTAPIEKLNTKYNVFGADLIREDSRFINYEVKVTGILKTGKRYTATGGLRTSRSTKQKSELDKRYAETIRSYSTLDSVTELDKFADKMLLSLQGRRNKGKLILPLYPKVDPLQTVEFTHTLFPELSGQYYVLEYQLKGDVNGFFQTLTVTDKVFAI